MSNQQETVESVQLLSDEVRHEIDLFLTAKRRAVVFALAEGGEAVQGDLATKIGSTVTSLANMTQKFDKFPHKLLESERFGKYRLYRLSALGRAYVEGTEQRDADPPDEDLDEEDRRIFREAETSLVCFRERYKDDWRVKLDDALLWRIRGCGSMGNESDEELVNRYLASLEQLVMRENYAAFEKALALLRDEILRNRMEAYMERFQSFLPVLRSLEDSPISFDVREVLRDAFCGQEAAEVVNYIGAIGWKPDEYTALKKVAEELTDITAGYGKKQIYVLFQGLLPNLDDLSFYLAQIIYSRQNPREEAGLF